VFLFGVKSKMDTYSKYKETFIYFTTVHFYLLRSFLNLLHSSFFAFATLIRKYYRNRFDLYTDITNMVVYYIIRLR
jgi:hypothetical protein